MKLEAVFAIKAVLPSFLFSHKLRKFSDKKGCIKLSIFYQLLQLRRLTIVLRQAEIFIDTHAEFYLNLKSDS